jgi:hypothetical protein
MPLRKTSVTGHHLDVLRRHAVGLNDHLAFIVADDHLAVVLPGMAGEVSLGRIFSSRSASFIVSRASFSGW